MPLINWLQVFRHVKLSESLCRSTFLSKWGESARISMLSGSRWRKASRGTHSSGTERCAVRRICLASSHAWPPWTDAQIALAQDLQLHPEDALSGPPVEGAADRQGSGRSPRNSSHERLPHFPALDSRRPPDAILLGSVCKLHENQLLDMSVIHGDGTTTVAKKGGDNLGFSGHKHMKGDKVVAFCDRNCNVIAPFVPAPGNRNELPLLREALPQLTQTARAIGLDLRGTIVSLDGLHHCRPNHKAIFNRGMKPKINPNPRGRKPLKRGRKPLFDPAIFDERLRTIERVFA